MSWAIGYDARFSRDIGYGVVAYCDHPDCSAQIDRGLAYVCANQEPRGGDGCGLYFCERHHGFSHPDNPELFQCCARCVVGEVPFVAKPEHPHWITWKHKDPSWNAWRQTAEGKAWLEAWPLPENWQEIWTEIEEPEDDDDDV